MTLIAAWKENDIPVLIGDLVVGATGEFEGTHHPLPTRDDLDELLPREWCRRIVDTCEKVCRVSSTLAIGWCGRKFSAEIIMKRIFADFQDRKPSLAEVKEYLCNITDCNDLPCTLIGWVIENGMAHCFQWSSDKPRDFQTPDYSVQGSGTEYFVDIFRPDIYIGKDPIEKVLSRIAYVLKDEVLYGVNLWNLFGGGFNIIYHGKDGFVMVPTVTYIFLQMEESAEHGQLSLLAPKRILKYSREGQVTQLLAVMLNDESISTSVGVSQVPKVATHEMYYTPPITAELGNSFQVDTNLPFTSEYYCLCVDVKCRDKLPPLGEDRFLRSSLVVCLKDKAKASYLQVTEEAGNVERLEIKDEFFKLVFDHLEALNRKALIRRELPDVICDYSDNENYGIVRNPEFVTTGQPPIIGHGGSCFLQAPGYLEIGTLNDFGSHMSRGFTIGIDIRTDVTDPQIICGASETGRTTIVVHINAEGMVGRLLIALATR